MKNCIVILFLLLSLQVSAKDKTFSSSGVAIRGYDTVAFFESEQAIQGVEKYQTQWQGTNWYFSNEKHLALFKQSPEKYAPQFGGFCALGAAHLGAVPSDPRAFSIHDGKLYFNMTEEVRITWRLNADFHIKRADKAWKEERITFYN